MTLRTKNARGTANRDLTAAQLLREIGRRHTRAQRSLIAAHGIPATHCTVLTELARHDSLPVSALAVRLRVDKGWVSRVTRQMIAEGFLRRDTRVTDRRVVSLRMTAAGRSLHRRTERLLDQQMERVLAAVGAGPPRSSKAFLERLALAYQGEVDAFAPKGRA